MTGYDPTGCWDWGKVLDFAITGISALAAIGAGAIKTGAALSTGKSVATGITTAVATFGGINNAVNSVYYNYYFNDYTNIESDSERSSYVDGYVSRWDRLDYTKQETHQDNYNFTAWSYYSEYSVHMYGWYVTGWAKNKKIPVFSNIATRAYKANVTSGAPDPSPYVEYATYILGILGV